jgi:hypothetical protein
MVSIRTTDAKRGRPGASGSFHHALNAVEKQTKIGGDSKRYGLACKLAVQGATRLIASIVLAGRERRKYSGMQKIWEVSCVRRDQATSRRQHTPYSLLTGSRAGYDPFGWLPPEGSQWTSKRKIATELPDAPKLRDMAVAFATGKSGESVGKEHNAR